MKRIKKIFLLLSLTVMASTLNIIALASLASAQSPPPLGGKYINGIGRLVYWLHPSSYNRTWMINTAVNAWVNMPSWMYLIPVSSNYGSNMDFYSNRPLPMGVLAQTTFFDIGGNQLQYTQNWYFTEISLNSGLLSQYNNEHQIGTIAHEMGHAFGLDHANLNPYSIMCQTVSGRVVQRPQEIDDAVVRNIYR